MRVQPLSLTTVKLSNNLFLAPMAGYTDYGFRHLQINNGIGLTFTELVSAKGIVYGGSNNQSLLYAGEDYDKTAVQIFGADPYFLRSACEHELIKNYKIVDINMGCPVPKVFKNGEGSALLKDIKKAEEIVSECVKSGKIITVKIRTGLKKGDDFASEFAKGLENAGASLITIHGRVREDYYSGEPDYRAIEKAKKQVKIPIIANGGVFTPTDATSLMDRTGVDGVMIARGSVEDPFLTNKILGNPIRLTLKEYILKHIELMKVVYPDKKATVEFRKFVCKYLKGIDNVKELKLQLMTANSTEEIANLINQNL